MTTRAEVHAHSSRHRVRQSRARVRRVLETECIGRNNAMHGTELAELVPIEYTTVRDIIAELRDDPQGPPIGGGSGTGYYVIENPDELADYVESTKETIANKRDRLEANVQAFNRRRYES